MAAITLEELLGQVGVHPEKLNNSISDDHLREIALFLPSWRTVATHLGFNEMDVDFIEHEGKDEQEKKLKALQMWRSKYTFKATYRRLVGVLLSLAMADVAEKICLLLKGMSIIMSYISSCTLYNNFSVTRSVHCAQILNTASTCNMH